MPFPNEYSARQENPDKYKSFHRQNNKFEPGIDVIFGILPDGKTEIQTIRFRTSKFKSKEQVKEWLEKHDFKTSIETPENDSTDSLINDCYQFDSLNRIKVYKQEDGSYKGIAYVTKTGVFEYVDANGKKIKQLRHPDDIYAIDSLNTLKMLPIIKYHTDKLITPEIIKNYLVGYTGENIEIDGNRVSVSILINTDEGIKAIENDGLLGLSCGYELDREKNNGVYENISYDYRQRNIKYNHLALCKDPRLGNDLRINLDSYDCILTNDNIDYQNSLFNFKKGETMPKFKIDGIEYECPQEVINTYSKLNNDSLAQITDLKNQLSTVTANYDSYKSKLEKTETELPTIINAAVNERVDLLSRAKIIFDSKAFEEIEKLSNIDIRKKVIIKYSPTINLDGKDNIYINACFDTVTTINKEEKNTSSNNQARGTNQGDSSGDIVETARKNYIKNLTEGYKQKK
jgi:hypothetical protein